MTNAERQPIAEQSILALSIRSEDHLKRALADGLTPDHFISHKPIFEAVEGLFRNGETIDPATIAGNINVSDFPDFEVTESVEKVCHQDPDPSGWRSWVSILRRAYASRIASDASQLVSATDTPETQQALLQEASESIKAALAGPIGAVDAKTACSAFLDKMREMQKSGSMPGISTGIEELDAISGGMRPGELWVCSGPTSGGKTVLMNQIAVSVCQAGKKGAFYSCEMLVDELIARSVATVGGANLTYVLQPNKWTEFDHSGKKHGERVTEAIKEISQMKAWFDDTPRMTLHHIENECQRLSDQNDGLDLIVVDYMQIVSPESGRRESREQEVARISGGLKQLAKRMKCPVLTGSQLNDDGRVRESRAIAFDANVMLGIEDEGIRIIKMRNGKRDKEGADPSLKLTLNGPLQRFE